MKRIPALLFLVLSAVLSAPAVAQESDEVPASLAGPALFRVGDCVAFFVSDSGLALTTRSCVSAAVSDEATAGMELDLSIDSPFLNGFDGLSLHFVSAPPAAVAEFGVDAVFPSRRLDFAFVRVNREGTGLKTERFLPMAPSGLEGLPDLRVLGFESAADSARVRSTQVTPKGFEYGGRVVPSSTSLFDLMDAHHGGGGLPGQTLPGPWSTIESEKLHAKLNMALEVEGTVQNGSPLVTEHFEVAGLVFGQTGPGPPPRSLAVSISAIQAALNQWLEGSAILSELRLGTRTTKSGIER